MRFRDDPSEWSRAQRGDASKNLIRVALSLDSLTLLERDRSQRLGRPNGCPMGSASGSATVAREPNGMRFM